jgi:hypothetical protein
MRVFLKRDVVQTYPLDFELDRGKMRAACFCVRIDEAHVLVAFLGYAMSVTLKHLPGF